MIPAKFDYVKPSSVEEAVAALAEGGEDAKIIAGGQSLCRCSGCGSRPRRCSSTSAGSPSCGASATTATPSSSVR